MESSYVCRIGGTPSYCDMVSSHPTCCPIVIDVRWPSKSATPWTTIRVTSSWRFTTSSVMGSPTLRPRPSPPRTCTTNPEFLQVAPHGGGRPSPKVKHQGRARRHCHQRRGGEERGPADPEFLTSGGGQHSKHACCEYWRRLLPVQYPREVPVDSQAGK